MRPLRGARLAVLAAAAVALAACAPRSAEPDLSGWWVWESPLDGGPPDPFAGAAYKPEFAETARLFDAAFRDAKLPDFADFGVDQRRSYCAPPRFAGFNGGFEDAVEFLLTPGRVTITNEGGLIRRIALGSSPPVAHYVTNAGTSAGRWEGSTLVVETVGVHPAGSFGPTPGIGKDARIVERFSLREPDVLQIVVHVTAPDILERPFETTLLYHREREHVFHDGSLSMNSCLIEDPSIDPETGRQRLDMTPPTDLPPPPSD